MSVSTYSSREFNQRASEAKKAANDGPVFITDRGRPAHVLLSYAQYLRLAGKPMNLADALAMSEDIDVDFDAKRSRTLARAADLS